MLEMGAQVCEPDVAPLILRLQTTEGGNLT